MMMGRAETTVWGSDFSCDVKHLILFGVIMKEYHGKHTGAKDRQAEECHSWPHHHLGNQPISFAILALFVLLVNLSKEGVCVLKYAV